MPRPQETRPHKPYLPESLEHRTKLYAAAAAAAGVSLLAMAPKANAEVVITRKNIPIPVSSYFGTQHLVPISLNNNGVTDFSFSLYSFAYHGFDQTLNIFPKNSGAVVGALGPRGVGYASALVRGGKIGPSAHFSSHSRIQVEDARGFDASSKYSRNLYGNWGGNPPNRYLGVKFLISGATHYGWVRLTVTTEPRGLSANITAYAYETIANQRILAGVAGQDAAEQTQPSTEAQPSLGMLALGAQALAGWRK